MMRTKMFKDDLIELMDNLFILWEMGNIDEGLYDRSFHKFLVDELLERKLLTICSNDGD